MNKKTTKPNPHALYRNVYPIFYDLDPNAIVAL